MQFKFLRGSSILIEGGGKVILTDPCLEDGLFYGSLAHYPPYDWRDSLNIDYIYISHVHGFCANTMKRLPRVPVLIHKFKSNSLCSSIEAMGFEVMELENGKITDLGGITINSIAADNQTASLSMRFFGCTEAAVKDTQIDSLAVFQDGRQTYVNVNDCPYELTKDILPKIRTQYPDIDVCFVAFTGTGPYPQCFEMPEYVKLKQAKIKKEQFLKHAALFARGLHARQTLPLAGDYVLCGKFAELNRYRGAASLSEVYRYFDEQGIPIIKVDIDDVDNRDKYIRDVLVHKSMDYENDPVPDDSVLIAMLEEAYNRFNAKRQEIGFKTSTTVYFPFEEAFMRLPMNGNRLSRQRSIIDQKYVKMKVDPRLLMRILDGKAHWSEAEIGSHIMYERKPDIFERGIYHSMGFLYV